MEKKKIKISLGKFIALMIVAVIVVIIGVIVVDYHRKTSIMESLQVKSEQYEANNKDLNHHYKSMTNGVLNFESYMYGGIDKSIEYYNEKGCKRITISKYNEEDGYYPYYTGIVDCFESNDGKIKLMKRKNIDDNDVTKVSIKESEEHKETVGDKLSYMWDTIFNTKINIVELDGKKCCESISKGSGKDENGKYKYVVKFYTDMESGQTIKIERTRINQNSKNDSIGIDEFEYETVTKNDIVLPNLSEYTLLDEDEYNNAVEKYIESK